MDWGRRRRDDVGWQELPKDVRSLCYDIRGGSRQSLTVMLRLYLWRGFCKCSISKLENKLICSLTVPPPTKKIKIFVWLP